MSSQGNEKEGNPNSLLRLRQNDQRTQAGSSYTSADLSPGWVGALVWVFGLFVYALSLHGTVGLSFLSILILGPIGICVLGWVLASNRAGRIIKAGIESISDFHADYSHSNATISGLAVDTKREKVCLWKRSGTTVEWRIIGFSDVLSCSLRVHQTIVTETKTRRSVGGFIAGGLIAGPAGAVVGGLGGARSTSTASEEYTLVIGINDLKTPTYIMYFSSTTLAEEWNARISIIIKQTDDREDSVPVGRNRIDDPKVKSATRVSALQDLLDKGLIDQGEFDKLKAMHDEGSER